MAVPKKRISKSKGGLRKGGSGAYRTKFPNVVKDKRGEHILSHHISADGYYKGKQIIKIEKDRPSEEVE